tara:strand:- start:487 stop:705 length:219 start_codon:yes stop_codon:yes gene_type:complete
MKKSDWFAQMWGNKFYIMRYRMKPEKITFNPYKNEYEKLLEVSRRNSKICILVFVLGMLLGIFASALVVMLT